MRFKYVEHGLSAVKREKKTKNKSLVLLLACCQSKSGGGGGGEPMFKKIQCQVTDATAGLRLTAAPTSERKHSFMKS